MDEPIGSDELLAALVPVVGQVDAMSACADADYRRELYSDLRDGHRDVRVMHGIKARGVSALRRAITHDGGPPAEGAA